MAKDEVNKKKLLQEMRAMLDHWEKEPFDDHHMQSVNFPGKENEFGDWVAYMGFGYKKKYKRKVVNRERAG